MLTYSSLQNYLQPNREYRTYSVKTRKYGKTLFVLLSIENRGITIRPSTGQNRFCPRVKVEEILSDWPVHGPRETLRDEHSPSNWNTSYIFGLIQKAREEMDEQGKRKGQTTNG